jgi:hypothetical protein
MFSDLFHRLIFHMAVVTVITTVWVSAWSKAVVDEANRSWWPAGPVHQQQVDARKPIVVAEP